MQGHTGAQRWLQGSWSGCLKKAYTGAKGAGNEAAQASKWLQNFHSASSNFSREAFNLKGGSRAQEGGFTPWDLQSPLFSPSKSFKKHEGYLGQHSPTIVSRGIVVIGRGWEVLHCFTRHCSVCYRFFLLLNVCHVWLFAWLLWRANFGVPGVVCDSIWHYLFWPVFNYFDWFQTYCQSFLQRFRCFRHCFCVETYILCTGKEKSFLQMNAWWKPQFNISTKNLSLCKERANIFRLVTHLNRRFSSEYNSNNNMQKFNNFTQNTHMMQYWLERKLVLDIKWSYQEPLRKARHRLAAFAMGSAVLCEFFRVSEKQFTQRQAATGLISVPRLSLSLVEYICSVRALCTWRAGLFLFQTLGKSPSSCSVFDCPIKCWSAKWHEPSRGPFPLSSMTVPIT